jgi:hypothetical protein
MIILIPNGIHQLLACDDDANLLGENLNNVKRNTSTSLDDKRIIIRKGGGNLGVCSYFVIRIKQKPLI